MITKIQIQNVKGFSVPGTNLAVHIDPKKVNLCIAPNGFGKSSITAALKSLKTNKLDVGTELKNSAHVNEPSFLSIELDGKEYCATEGENELYSKARLQSYVINSRVVPAYRRIEYNGFRGGKSYMTIGCIDLCSAKTKPKSSYKCTEYKAEFGPNGKLLKSIKDYIDDSNFMSSCSELYGIFDKFKQRRTYKLIDDLVNQINLQSGTSQEIQKTLNDKCFKELDCCKEYHTFQKLLTTKDTSLNKLDSFLVFFQLLQYYSKCKKEFKSICEFSSYVKLKRSVRREIDFLNTSGAEVALREEDGKLRVIFPNADRLSNGQRDVLTFVTQLIHFKAIKKDTWNYILVIDEVFDYLDDANIVAAQYYLSKILKEDDYRTYILLMTHLNPFTFRSYLMNKNVLNFVYLHSSIPESKPATKRFIAWRDEQKKSNKDIYITLCAHFFHYNPTSFDLTQKVDVERLQNFKKTWLSSDVYRAMLIDEMNIYLSRKNNYDPYAVACALRIMIEKKLYLKLRTKDQQTQFIETETTSSKMALCEDFGVKISDAYGIVNAIQNEAHHLQYTNDENRNCHVQEKSAVYMLQHNVIHHIIEQIFEYNGNPFPSDFLL